MDEFKDSKNALIADVDCTTDGKSLCEKHKVQGYPTIKWGDPADLKDYDGGRSFDDLKKFAEENLGPTCGPDNLDLCSEDDKAIIQKVQKMDVDELDTKVEEADATIKNIEEKAQKAVDKLESKIGELRKKIEKETKNKEELVAKQKQKLNLRFMKAVVASKKKKEDL
eukprot:TRINITY_DN1026_c0_g1_i1.p1 TRINITY_DN1026_c0_g1~~TRINITY_DN1026_c0_g1_i1.p1  ORF type:complete len:168 (-),score=59.39 TRINITY_DN1026_c0_g1_i1:140-643(-)